jgi:hypothetical protein
MKYTTGNHSRVRSSEEPEANIQLLFCSLHYGVQNNISNETQSYHYSHIDNLGKLGALPCLGFPWEGSLLLQQKLLGSTAAASFQVLVYAEVRESFKRC